MEKTTCRSCGAAILWLRMESGSLNPVEAEPVADGNIRLLEDGSGDMLTALERFAYDGAKYLSHFARCPNAKQHRKAKK